MKVVTFYIYSAVLPTNELTLYRCVKCSRPIFKAGGDAMVISNALTPNFNPNITTKGYFEIMCHSCKTEYKVLWQ